MATVQRPARKHPAVQKILIPSGLVRANETVVIEVPSNLKRHPVVVATRPGRRLSDGMGDEAVPRYPGAFAGEAAPPYREKDKETDPPQDGDYAEDDALVYDVDEAEKAERELLFRNLRAFHMARRNVLQGTKKLLSKTFGGMPSEMAADADLAEEDSSYFTDAVDYTDNDTEYDSYSCALECPQKPQPMNQQLSNQQLALQQQQQQQQQLALQQQQQQQQQLALQQQQQQQQQQQLALQQQQQPLQPQRLRVPQPTYMNYNPMARNLARGDKRV